MKIFPLKIKHTIIILFLSLASANANAAKCTIKFKISKTAESVPIRSVNLVQIAAYILPSEKAKNKLLDKYIRKGDHGKIRSGLSRKNYRGSLSFERLRDPSKVQANRTYSSSFEVKANRKYPVIISLILRRKGRLYKYRESTKCNAPTTEIKFSLR